MSESDSKEANFFQGLTHNHAFHASAVGLLLGGGAWLLGVKSYVKIGVLGGGATYAYMRVYGHSLPDFLLPKVAGTDIAIKPIEGGKKFDDIGFHSKVIVG